MVKNYSLKLLIILFLGLVPVFASAATLSVSPASGTLEVGQKVTIRLVVSGSTPVNAISGSVSFPTSLLNIDSISKTGSVLNFWVKEPNFSESTGTLHFEGVSLGGFSGGTGTVLTAVLQATKVGSAKINFTSGQILANDGQGTDVTSGLSGASFTVVPKKETKKPDLPKEVAEPEVLQPAPTLKSPEIVLVKKFGEQAISGTSDYREAQVLLTFISESGVKIFITGATDTNGEFVLLVPKTLKQGVYRVSAVVILKDITNSHTSNEIIITVGNILSDVSLQIWIAIGLLMLTFIYLLIRSYLHLQKNKKLRSFVKREAKEVEDITRKSFKVLNEEVEDVMENGLSRIEKSDIKNIKKDLSEAEELIIKEIKDIEKI